MRRCLGLFLLALLLIPSPAMAHSNSVETRPERGARLTTLPAEATLTFSEAPKTADAVLEGPNGKVHTLKPQVVGSVVKVRLPSTGPRGAYTLSYRIVSADGHPVSGSVTFTVTDGSEPVTSPTPAPVETDEASADRDRASRWSALAMAGGAALVALAAGLLFWLMRR